MGLITSDMVNDLWYALMFFVYDLDGTTSRVLMDMMTNKAFGSAASSGEAANTSTYRPYWHTEWDTIEGPNGQEIKADFFGGTGYIF